jgi:hypothetical protein
MTAMSAEGEPMTPEKRQAYITFFESMPDILPCTMCGKHLKDNLKILPVDPDNLFEWSVDLHNLVNTQLNKPEISYNASRRYWSARCLRGPSREKSLLMILVVIIGLLLVAYYLK